MYKIAPNGYGLWADVCGGKFLFGNQIVKISIAREDISIQIEKKTGYLGAKRAEMLQPGPETDHI